MNANILPNQRILVVGKSGSGKTYLTLNVLVPNFKNYVVYDYKHEIQLPRAKYFTRVSEFGKYPGENKIIYRPTTGEDEEFNDLCGAIFKRRNTMFVVDELANHCSQHHIQQNHALILRLGRSLGIGNINCAQEPVGIHRNIMTQAEHFFIFDIPDESHRGKLAGYTGPQVKERLDSYWFWYYGTGMHDPVLMQPVKC